MTDADKKARDALDTALDIMPSRMQDRVLADVATAIREAEQRGRLNTALESLASMTPDERLDFLAELPYCRHCGYDDPEHRCQCSNDE